MEKLASKFQLGAVENDSFFPTSLNFFNKRPE
uniref:Uncharacterized protein n=1 Tax=Setaria italica TaxID=4555 RepID=K3Y3V2_SETIT